MLFTFRRVCSSRRMDHCLHITKQHPEENPIMYEARPESKFPLDSFTETKPNIIERFIGTDTASVELFFNIFSFTVETFVTA